MTRALFQTSLSSLQKALAALLAPQYIFFANNADGRIFDAIVYGEADHDWIYSADGLFPAIIFLAELHYKDSLIEGDYAVTPGTGELATDFGIEWLADPDSESRTGYRAKISAQGLRVAPSVILMFAYDAIERMHVYSYRKVKDWRFQIENPDLLDQLERKKIVNANGLLDIFQVFLTPNPAPVAA